MATTLLITIISLVCNAVYIVLYAPALSSVVVLSLDTQCLCRKPLRRASAQSYENTTQWVQRTIAVTKLISCSTTIPQYSHSPFLVNFQAGSLKSL